VTAKSRDSSSRNLISIPTNLVDKNSVNFSGLMIQEPSSYPCLSFFINGTCELGRKCKYSHSPFKSDKDIYEFIKENENLLRVAYKTKSDTPFGKYFSNYLQSQKDSKPKEISSKPKGPFDQQIGYRPPKNLTPRNLIPISHVEEQGGLQSLFAKKPSGQGLPVLTNSSPFAEGKSNGNSLLESLKMNPLAIKTKQAIVAPTFEASIYNPSFIDHFSQIKATDKHSHTAPFQMGYNQPLAMTYQNSGSGLAYSPSPKMNLPSNGLINELKNNDSIRKTLFNNDGGKSNSGRKNFNERRVEPSKPSGLFGQSQDTEGLKLMAKDKKGFIGKIFSRDLSSKILQIDEVEKRQQLERNIEKLKDLAFKPFVQMV
jgi:hypothetical protein